MALSSVVINMGDWYALNGGNTTTIQSKMDSLFQWCYDCNIGKTNDDPIIIQFNSLMGDINTNTTYAVNEQAVLAIAIPILRNKGLKFALSLSSGGGPSLDQANGPWWDNTGNFAAAYAEIEAKIDWYYFKGYSATGDTDNAWYITDMFFHNWFATNKTRTDNVKTYLINVMQKAYTKKGGAAKTGIMYLHTPMALTWLNDYSYADVTANTNMNSWIGGIYSNIGARKVKIYIMSSDQVGGGGFGYPGALGTPPADYAPGGSFYTQMLIKLSNIYTTVINSSGKTKIFPKVILDLCGMLNYPSDGYPYSAPFSRIKDQIDNEGVYSITNVDTSGCAGGWVTGDAMWYGFDDSTMRDAYKTFYFSVATETVTIPTTAPTTTNGSPIVNDSVQYTSALGSSSKDHTLSYRFDWKGDGSDISQWGSQAQSKLWGLTGSYNVKSQAGCLIPTDNAYSAWSPGLSVTVSAAATGNYAWANAIGGPWTLESKTPKYEIDQTGLVIADWESAQIQLNEDIYSSDHLVAGNMNNASQVLFTSYHSYYLNAGLPSSWIPLNILAKKYDLTHFGSVGFEGIFVRNNVLYVQGVGDGTGDGWLNIIDLTSNPLGLDNMISFSDADLKNAEGIDVELGPDGKLYAFNACYGNNRVTIINVTTPNAMIKTSTLTGIDYDGPTWCNVSGNYCFVTTYGCNNFNTQSRSVPGKIITLDITNPASPVQVGTILSSMNLAGAETTILVGNYLYVAVHYYTSNTGGMVVVDVSNPLLPTIVSAYTASNLFGCEGIAISGNYAYIAGMYNGSHVDQTGTLKIVDITDPLNPVGKGSVSDATYLKKMHEVIVHGNYAYCCACGDSRITVVDISNKDAPIFPVTGTWTLKDVTALNAIVRVVENNGYLYTTAAGAITLSVLGT